MTTLTTNTTATTNTFSLATLVALLAALKPVQKSAEEMLAAETRRLEARAAADRLLR